MEIMMNNPIHFDSIVYAANLHIKQQKLEKQFSYFHVF